MALRQDFLLRDDLDFPLEDNIVGGVLLDTPYGYSDEQHKGDLIEYNLGSLKEFPTTGFGVNSYLNSEFNLHGTAQQLQITMNSDGYNVTSGTLSSVIGGGFTIATKYITNKYS